MILFILGGGLAIAAGVGAWNYLRVDPDELVRATGYVRGRKFTVAEVRRGDAKGELASRAGLWFSAPVDDDEVQRLRTYDLGE